MTGEISLTGKVLPVGGIKEKILAARRSGARIIVLPEACRREYDGLPDYVREELDVHFAKTYEDVFKVAFSSSGVDHLEKQTTPDDQPALEKPSDFSQPVLSGSSRNGASYTMG